MTSARAARFGRYLGEMVVVVLSILTAFGVDASWDRYQAAREETETPAALRIDFENSLSLLESRWIPIHSAAMVTRFERLSPAFRPLAKTRTTKSAEPGTW